MFSALRQRVPGTMKRTLSEDDQPNNKRCATDKESEKQRQGDAPVNRLSNSTTPLFAQVRTLTRF